MKTNYFESCQTIDQAKKLYYSLALQLHPDRGGDVAAMQELNAQFEAFKPQTEKYKGEAQDFSGRDYASIIAQLVNIPEIVVEIVGSFIWLSGNTKPYKDQIKKVDVGGSYKRACWHKTKNMWFYSPALYRRYTNKEYSMEEIREFYGSTRVEKTEKRQVQGA